VKILDRYLLKQFFPVFVASAAMFVLLVVLIDLFVNLVRFLNNGATVGAILRVSLYYMPKSFLYALPVSLLFSSAYTLGDLYARNELSTVLCSGVPFWRVCVPLFAVGVIASFFSFFFEDKAVIPALRMKNEMSREILQTQKDDSGANVVIKSEGGRVIYAADYYDGIARSLTGLFIITRDENRSFISIIRAPRADWNGNEWVLINPVAYEMRDGFLRPGILSDARYDENPEIFKRSTVAAAELNAREAALLIHDLREAGLPVLEAEADYHHRFSFSSVSFVVVFLSVTLGGRFRKNILLMNLLASLGTAVLYYVVEMITMMSARLGLLPPVMGAWIPVLVCLTGGFFLLRYAKT
jgi:lipopolysaccharide export system permease protein